MGTRGVLGTPFHWYVWVLSIAHENSRASRSAARVREHPAHAGHTTYREQRVDQTVHSCDPLSTPRSWASPHTLTNALLRGVCGRSGAGPTVAQLTLALHALRHAYDALRRSCCPPCGRRRRIAKSRCMEARLVCAGRVHMHFYTACLHI